MTNEHPEESNDNRTELVITRRPGESVWLETLDGKIRITQLTRWRLKIEAPRSVIVIRDDATSES